MSATGTATTLDLLDPAVVPQDQGWLVINEQRAPTNFNPDRTIQAMADGSAVTVSSIGLPPDIEGIPTSALQWFYRDVDVDMRHPYTVEFSARVDTLVSQSNAFDSAAMLYAGTEDPTGFGRFTGLPRAQMIMLDADQIRWGDESQSFAIDTTDGFHDYRVEIAPDGYAEVYVDDTLALWRDDFQALEYIGFGDMTNDVNLDGTMSIADIQVSGIADRDAETTTYYFNGVVSNTSFEDYSDLVIAAFFDLLAGETTTYTLEIDNDLLQPGQSVALDWDDPSFAFDVPFNGNQIGPFVFDFRGITFQPSDDLSSLDQLLSSVGDSVDGPSITLHELFATIDTDDDVNARLDGVWVANQPGLPDLPQIVGNAAADSLAGTDAGDFLRGLDGDDQARGFDGDDVIDGGLGDDNLYGKAGDDRLFGQAGNDSMRGDDGADTLFGGAGDDFVRGGDDHDLLFGEAGDDVMEGDGGDDVLTGGDGADSLRGETGNDTLLGNRGDDWLKGGSGDDVLSGLDGNDVAYGNDGIDIINGGLGDDRLYGGSGDDTLFGGRGDDFLDGDPGDDLFVVTFQDGHDLIAGFQAGAGSDDVIDFSAMFFRSFYDLASLLAVASYDGAATTFALDTAGNASLTLLGVAPADLHEDDFNFG